MNYKYPYLSKQFDLCVLLALLSACSQNRKKDTGSNGNIGSAKQLMVLNNQTNLSKDIPLVSAVSMAVTDAENNIYLADPRTLNIHSYTADLTYRWTTGGKGKGPTSFTSITALFATNDKLYVYDYANSTMHLYSLKGKLLNEWVYNEGAQNINNIRQIKSGEFVAVGWDEKTATLVHIYSNDFKKRLYGFVKGSEVFHTEYPELEKQVVRNFPGYVYPVNNTTILYSPPSYNGQLLLYKQLANKKWGPAGTVKGYMHIEAPMVFHLSSKGNNKRSLLSGTTPQGGYFHTEFTSMSFGLFGLNSGQIAHLSIKLNKKDHWDLVVEYFDPKSLNLTDYTIVKSLIPSQRFQQMPIWMDGQGKIYMNQNSDKPLKILKISKK